MSTIKEIEKAIENLPGPQVLELAGWFDKFREERAIQTPFETWLANATGAARPGVTTAEIMAMTRGED